MKPKREVKPLTPLERLSAAIRTRQNLVEQKRKLYLDLARVDNDIVATDETIKGILLAHFNKAGSVPTMEPSTTEAKGEDQSKDSGSHAESSG